MIISKRLKYIASFVRKDMIIADIGADHGLLSYYLLKNNYVDKVYACDNKVGPFENLKKTFKDSNLDISIALKNGLEDLPSYVNTILIAGMGGELIIKILSEGKDKLSQVDHLILSPHLDIPNVRNFLQNIGYKIINEGIVLDDKYYVVIVATKGNEILNKKQILLGPRFLENKSVDLINYWKAKTIEIKSILNIKNIDKNKRDELINHLKLYEEEL